MSKLFDSIEVDEYAKGYVDAWFEAIDYFHSENKLGVSDSPPEHEGLPLVRKRNASEEPQTLPSESEHGTLENRIDSERLCVECSKRPAHVVAWCQECFIDLSRKAEQRRKNHSER